MCSWWGKIRVVLTLVILHWIEKYNVLCVSNDNDNLSHHCSFYTVRRAEVCATRKDEWVRIILDQLRYKTPTHFFQIPTSFGFNTELKIRPSSACEQAFYFVLGALWVKKSSRLCSSKLKKMSKAGPAAGENQMKKTVNSPFSDGSGSFFTTKQTFPNGTESFY